MLQSPQPPPEVIKELGEQQQSRVMRLSLWRWQCEWDVEDVAQCLGLVSAMSRSSSRAGACQYSQSRRNRAFHWRSLSPLRMVLVHAKVAKTRARCNGDKKEWMFEINEVASKTELENAVQEFDKQRAAAETRAQLAEPRKLSWKGHFASWSSNAKPPLRRLVDKAEGQRGPILRDLGAQAEKASCDVSATATASSPLSQSANEQVAAFS